MPLPSEPSDLDTYGGPKIDADDPVDGDTDRKAAEVNQAFLDLGQMTNMTHKARLAFTVADGVVRHRALWGSALAIKPNFVHAGTGVFSFTFPTSITDALGEVHDISFTDGLTNFTGSTPYVCNVTVDTANTITVRVWSVAGSLTNPAGVVSVFLA